MGTPFRPTHRLKRYVEPYPMGPCTPLAYTLAPKYLHRDYFKAEVYTFWENEAFGVYKSPRNLHQMDLTENPKP